MNTYKDMIERMDDGDVVILTRWERNGLLEYMDDADIDPDDYRMERDEEGKMNVWLA